MVKTNPILLNQPIGFLQQLGQLLGEPVGLGEYSVENRGFGIKWHLAQVRTKDRILGTYEIGVVKGSINVYYSGYHPLGQAEGSNQIGLFYNPLSDRRTDNWENIVFPGTEEMLKREVRV